MSPAISSRWGHRSCSAHPARSPSCSRCLSFCVVVIATRLTGTILANRSIEAFEILIGVKILLLIAGAMLAIHFGPFHDGDSREAIATGMVLVAAMAIQNAVQRVHLANLPPTTLMTGSTTQATLDTVDLITGSEPGDAAALRSRFGRLSLSILAFAVGCAAPGMTVTVEWRDQVREATCK